MRQECAQFTCHGAIYGKADNQPTDYRWLDVSEAKFRGASTPAISDRFVRAISLGQEILNGRDYFAWRVFENRYYAIRAYESKARDSAGRGQIVEKAILELADPGSAPLANMALAMFRGLDPPTFQSRWWSQRDRGEWRNSSFHLDGIELNLQLASDADLKAEVEAGLQYLRDRQEQLVDAYSELLAGERTAVFEVPSGRPVSGHAVIFGILSASAEFFRLHSVAGGLPGSTDITSLSGWPIVVAEEGRVRCNGQRSQRELSLRSQAQSLVAKLFGVAARPDFETLMREFSNPDPIRVRRMAELEAFLPLNPSELVLVEDAVKVFQRAAGNRPSLNASRRMTPAEFRNMRLHWRLEELERFKRVAGGAKQLEAAALGSGVPEHRPA